MRDHARPYLEREIDELPSEYRTVFVLRALEGMSVAQVASCLRISRSLVRMQFVRARRLLRKAVGREMKDTLNYAFPCDGSRCERIVSTVLQRVGEHLVVDA